MSNLLNENGILKLLIICLVTVEPNKRMFQPGSRMQVNVLRHRGSLLTTPRISREEASATPKCRATCQESFRQYLLHTTLHGLKYIGDNTITLFERIFFGLMFFAVLLLSAYFISNVYLKYSASPMIISLNSISTDITQLPFPGITVCNMNQLSISKAVKSVVKQYSTQSDEYSMIQSICTHAVDENVTNSKVGKWADYQKMLINNYGGFDYDCNDVFVTVLTDEGLCCTFNGVHKKFIAKSNIKDPQEFNISKHLEEYANDWTPEGGFSSDELKKHKLGYPRPTVGTGTNLGLTILLDAGISEYYCSSTNSYGFKILLHSPNEAPRITNYGTSISNGYESRVIITPTISEASKSVRKMPVSIRQCLFENENYLMYYRTYSRGNCEMECTAKIYLSYCGCILYWMPRFEEDITICGRADDACVENVTEQLNAKRNSSFVCDCLPGCFEISYDAEVSMAPILQDAPILRNISRAESNVSVAHIFYKNNFFRSQKKDELIGFTEFLCKNHGIKNMHLSNTGGLLGLYMGFSVFSIIEIFYFLSIRPYSNYRISERRRQTIGRMVRKVRKLRTRRLLPPPPPSSHIDTLPVQTIHTIYP